MDEYTFVDLVNFKSSLRNTLKQNILKEGYK